MVAAGGLLAVVLSAACVQLAPQAWSRLSGSAGRDLDAGTIAALEAQAVAAAAGQATATASPEAAAAGARTGGAQAVAVRRGPITETLALQGRVAGQEEVPVTFPARGVVEGVLVKPGDEVQEGQVLLEAESKALVRELTAARARLDSAAIRVTQAQAQAQAVQRENDRRLQAERAHRQSVVVEAEAALQRMLADLDRVRAGPSRAEREAAEGAVIQARGALERAETDLARLQAGPNTAELRIAEPQVTAARLALQRAEAEVARLARGPDLADVRAAERDLATAQTAVDRAQAELNRLTRGGDPAEVRAAEREVARAQSALRAAEGSTAAAADANARIAREAAITSARLDVQQAQDRLGLLREPARASDLEIARRTLEIAQQDVEAARGRLEAVRRGPDRLALDTAQAAVDSARLVLESATARLLELQAGPSADQVAAATQAAAAARTTLAGATARADELNARPTAAELREAEDRVTVARTALARAQAEAQLAQPAGDAGTYDLALLQNALEQERAQVAGLERELAETRLRAPVQGTVVAVQVRSGDPLEPGRPAILLARPGQHMVRADLTDREAARLAAGQTATVQLGASPPAGAVVAAIAPGENGVGQVALIAVEWPAPPVAGVEAQVAVVVQQKEDVLLVPRHVVRSAGVRRFVQYLDGATRRVANVELGIVAGEQVEIVSGLVEGQLVLGGS
jgi:multidrug resistance efflux pump